MKISPVLLRGSAAEECALTAAASEVYALVGLGPFVSLSKTAAIKEIAAA